MDKEPCCPGIQITISKTEMGKTVSWQTINRLLGLAMTDQVFAERLLKEPREALHAYGIQLEVDELETLCACQSQTLEELSQQLVEKLGSESS